MKRLLFIFLCTFLSVSSIKAQDYIYTVESVLTVLGWDLSSNRAPDNIRNVAIVHLSNTTNTGGVNYQSYNNEQLLDALVYSFYLQLRGIKPGDLRNYTVDGMRNTTIVIVSNRTGRNGGELQGMGASSIVMVDGVNIGTLNGLYNRQNEWAVNDKYTPRVSTGQCTQLDNAMRAVGALTPEIVRLKNDYEEIIGKIEYILNTAKKIPGVKSIYNLYVKTNPALQAYEREKWSKLNEIARLEGELLRNRNLISDPSIVGPCSICKTNMKVLAEERLTAKDHATFMEFMQYVRSLTVVDNGQAIPNQKGYDDLHNEMLKALDNMDSELWQYCRNTWLRRNEAVPVCQ